MEHPATNLNPSCHRTHNQTTKTKPHNILINCLSCIETPPPSIYFYIPILLYVSVYVFDNVYIKYIKYIMYRKVNNITLNEATKNNFSGGIVPLTFPSGKK